MAAACEADATSPPLAAATDWTSVVSGVTWLEPVGAVITPVNASLVAVSTPPVSTNVPVVVPGPRTK